MNKGSLRQIIEPVRLSDKFAVQLGLGTEDSNRRWYEGITGRIPVGWYMVALCYATAVILLGWWPWNILLILPVLSIGNRNLLRVSAFVTPEESAGSKAFCGRGGLL